MDRTDIYASRERQTRIELTIANLQVAGVLGLTLEAAAHMMTVRKNRPFRHNPEQIQHKIAERLGERVGYIGADFDDKEKPGRVYFLVGTESGYYRVGIRNNGGKVLSVQKILEEDDCALSVG